MVIPGRAPRTRRDCIMPPQSTGPVPLGGDPPPAAGPVPASAGLESLHAARVQRLQRHLTEARQILQSMPGYGGCVDDVGLLLERVINRAQEMQR